LGVKRAALTFSFKGKLISFKQCYLVLPSIPSTPSNLSQERMSERHQVGSGRNIPKDKSEAPHFKLEALVCPPFSRLCHWVRVGACEICCTSPSCPMYCSI
jgi:hypothetical protein